MMLVKPKNRKRPTAKKWLEQWFKKNGGETTLNELCFWMPNGLWGPKRKLFDAFEELGMQVHDNGRLTVPPPHNRGGKISRK